MLTLRAELLVFEEDQRESDGREVGVSDERPLA